MFCAAEVCPGLRAIVLFPHGKEFDHESEIVCFVCGIAVVRHGIRGGGRGLLREGGRLLWRKLLQCRQLSLVLLRRLLREKVK